MTPNGIDYGPAIAALSSRVADWELILNRTHGEMQGEMIRVVSALRELTEEFKALRQAVVNIKPRLKKRKAH